MDNNKRSGRVSEKELQEFRSKVVASCWDISQGFLEEVASDLNHEK